MFALITVSCYSQRNYKITGDGTKSIPSTRSIGHGQFQSNCIVEKSDTDNEYFSILFRYYFNTILILFRYFFDTLHSCLLQHLAAMGFKENTII